MRPKRSGSEQAAYQKHEHSKRELQKAQRKIERLLEDIADAIFQRRQAVAQYGKTARCLSRFGS